jgi:hypothetical protein
MAEVSPFDQGYGQTSQGGIPGDTRPVDTTPNNHHVEDAIA